MDEKVTLYKTILKTGYPLSQPGKENLRNKT